MAGWVDRAELVTVVSALRDAGDEAVALTTGLVGAGGFGKTMLAARACQAKAVQRRFPGGVCWITVGRDLDGQGLAQRISEAVWNLCGESHTFTNVEEAGRALAGALAARRRTLLVADDVWTGGQLVPFVTAGRAGRLLVTTRRPAVLAGAGARSIEVDAVPREVARRMLTRGLTGMAGHVEESLLELAGGWPLLLGVINGRLVEDLSRGGNIDATARGAARRLRRDGPAALDIKDMESRQLAVAATIRYSLDTLDDADQDRFYQLGIFAEDAEIPLPLITTLWQATATAEISETDVVALCEWLDGLSLVSLAWAGSIQVIVIHDVIRDFARSTLGPERIAELNGMLVTAAGAALSTVTLSGAYTGGPTVAWWELHTSDGYLRGHLVWHLIEARRKPEAEALACDLRWAGTRLTESGPSAVAADLAVVGTPRAARMATVVVQVAHLLAPDELAGAVVDTLHSRLAADPDWGPQVTALKDTYRRPRLVNRWPLPDLPSPVLRAELEVNGTVRGVCAVTVAGRQLLASAGDDQTVRIWELATGAQQLLLNGHEGQIDGVCAVTVAGRELLASASDDATVRIWDPATGAQRAVLKGHQGWVRGVCAVTVDGRELLASAGEDATVRIWDPATGAQRAVLKGHQGWVRGVCAVTVAGRELLASASDDATVRIWDPATGAQRAVLKGHQGWVRGVCAVTVAGRELLASASDDATVRIWDPATGAQQTVLKGHQGQVLGVCAVTVDGRQLLASVGYDRTVRIWDPATGAQQTVLTGHQGQILGVCAVTVDGRQLLASAGTDRTVRIWDPTRAEQADLEGHQGWVRAMCTVTVAERPVVVSAGDDGTVRIWNPATGSQLLAFESHERSAYRVCPVTVDGRQLLASASDDATVVRIWDPATGAEQAVLEGHQFVVHGICAVTVDGRELLASADMRTVRIWDPATGAEQAVLKGLGDVMFGQICAVTVDGHQLLADTGNYATMRIWDPATSAQRAVLEGHRATVTGVCTVTVAGRELLASASDDATVRIWDPATGAQRAVLEGHHGIVRGVCAVTVADRNLLASVGADRTVRIWDPATRRALAVIRVERSLFACAPIGCRGLAAGGEGGVYGFDILLGADVGE